MASKIHAALSLLALAQNVAGIAFPAPQPTVVRRSPDKALEGFSPKTTESGGDWLKHELVKRVAASSRTCGFIGTSVLTCAVGTCMFYTTGGVGMAGCCYGMTDGDCGWATKCIDYADYNAGKCDAACRANAFNRVCSTSGRPYCQSWTYANGYNVKDYGCGTDSGSVFTTVSATVSNALGLTSADLPFAAQAVVATLGSTSTSLRSIFASGTTSTYRSGSTTSIRYSGGSSYSSSTTSTAVAIIPIVVVLVLILGGWLGAACLLFYCCRRSKKLTAKWEQGNVREAVPLNPNSLPANVTTPQPYQGAQGGPIQPVGGNTEYFGGAAAVGAGGAAAGYYEGQKAASPPAGYAAPGSPAPPYQGPPSQQMGYPPPAGYQSPPPAGYQSPSPQQNYSYPGAPQPYGAPSPQQYGVPVQAYAPPAAAPPQQAAKPAYELG